MRDLQVFTGNPRGGRWATGPAEDASFRISDGRAQHPRSSRAITWSTRQPDPGYLRAVGSPRSRTTRRAARSAPRASSSPGSYVDPGDGDFVARYEMTPWSGRGRCCSRCWTRSPTTTFPCALLEPTAGGVGLRRRRRPGAVPGPRRPGTPPERLRGSAWTPATCLRRRRTTDEPGVRPRPSTGSRSAEPRLVHANDSMDVRGAFRTATSASARGYRRGGVRRAARPPGDRRRPFHSRRRRPGAPLDNRDILLLKRLRGMKKFATPSRQVTATQQFVLRDPRPVERVPPSWTYRGCASRSWGLLLLGTRAVSGFPRRPPPVMVLR